MTLMNVGYIGKSQELKNSGNQSSGPTKGGTWLSACNGSPLNKYETTEVAHMFLSPLCTLPNEPVLSCL